MEIGQGDMLRHNWRIYPGWEYSIISISNAYFSMSPVYAPCCMIESLADLTLF